MPPAKHVVFQGVPAFIHIQLDCTKAELQVEIVVIVMVTSKSNDKYFSNNSYSIPSSNSNIYSNGNSKTSSCNINYSCNNCSQCFGISNALPNVLYHVLEMAIL